MGSVAFGPDARVLNLGRPRRIAPHVVVNLVVLVVVERAQKQRATGVRLVQVRTAHLLSRGFRVAHRAHIVVVQRQALRKRQLVLFQLNEALVEALVLPNWLVALLPQVSLYLKVGR